MIAHWRRGCLGLVMALLGLVIVVGMLAGVGVLVGSRQPGGIWAVPLSRGYFAIGRLVSSADCRRLRARELGCAERYGAVLYLSGAGADGHGVEYTLFALADPF
jgi:hypothetical protein